MVAALGIIPINLEKMPKEIVIKGKIEIIQASALFRSVRILRSVLNY